MPTPSEKKRRRSQADSAQATRRPAVLFLCVQNAGRSQMAAAWLEYLAGDAVDVYSGGSQPGSEVHPVAIEAMAEVGIDITGRLPRAWTNDMVGAADVIITMGCGDVCPVYPAKRYQDWAVSDPNGLDVAAVRPIRDDIESRVRALLEELGVEVSP